VEGTGHYSGLKKAMKREEIPLLKVHKSSDQKSAESQKLREGRKKAG